MRAFAAEAKQLSEDPGSICTLVALQTENWNPAIHNYLTSYLFQHQPASVRNGSAHMNLIENPCLTTGVCCDPAVYATSSYFMPGVPELFKLGVLIRVADLAQQSDTEKAARASRHTGQPRSKLSGTDPKKHHEAEPACRAGAGHCAEIRNRRRGMTHQTCLNVRPLQRAAYR